MPEPVVVDQAALAAVAQQLVSHPLLQHLDVEELAEAISQVGTQANAAAPTTPASKIFASSQPHISPLTGSGGTAPPVVHQLAA